MPDLPLPDPRRIFFPYAAEATERVQRGGGRFVYYTSAETAFRILSSKEIWMRSTRTMNDYMEVQHGIECVHGAFGSDGGRAFAAAVDAIFPGLFAEIDGLYKGWAPGFQADTFVTCVSEHSSNDDRYGRLSMWRAYGGRAGVAIVLNGDVMFRESDALAAYSSPVAYMETQDVAAQLQSIAVEFVRHFDFLHGLGRDAMRNYLLQMLRLAAVCTKHPGFEEEKEWRIVSSPSIQRSDLLAESVEVVGGIPQIVLKIKLEDHPDKNLVGLQIPALIDRILIGPTEYPAVVHRALFHLLLEAGMSNPSERLFTSNIPLREVQR